MKFLAFFSLIAAVAADKQSYLRNLMQVAKPTENSQLRFLEQNYQIDISGYSVKFQQCQFVRAYDEELAEDEESSTILATKRFVIFRLCPNNECSSCSYGYGEYLVDLDTYLQVSTEYFKEQQEYYCQVCEENCQNNNNGNNNNGNNNRFLENEDGDNNNANNNNNANYNCNQCQEDCNKYENMEDNYMVDATNFLECTVVMDPEDDNKVGLYAGPVCSNSGKGISIGLFKDQYCTIPDTQRSVSDYLNDDNGNSLQLSHSILKQTYHNTCISCKEPQDDQENNGGNDNKDEDDVIELCENLYTASAKCEAVHGFSNGYAKYNGYENQIENEETVCGFVNSLKSGTYDEQGEISVTGANGKKGSESTSAGQKVALTFFILGTAFLAVYAAMLHSKLVKGGKTEMSSQGGAMA